MHVFDRKKTFLIWSMIEDFFFWIIKQIQLLINFMIIDKIIIKKNENKIYRLSKSMFLFFFFLMIIDNFCFLLRSFPIIIIDIFDWKFAFCCCCCCCCRCYSWYVGGTSYITIIMSKILNSTPLCSNVWTLKFLAHH